MENVTILVLDFILLTLGISLIVGILLGIVGLIMWLSNRNALKNGRSVSKNKKQYADAFCLLGIISVGLSLVLVVLYFVLVR